MTLAADHHVVVDRNAQGSAAALTSRVIGDE